MALSLTWSDADVESVKRVLLADVSTITPATMKTTQTFIDTVKAGGNIRKAYNKAMVTLLSYPDQLIYFVRRHVQERIYIRYKDVPEFEHVVNFYFSIVIAARSRI